MHHHTGKEQVAVYAISTRVTERITLRTGGAHQETIRGVIEPRNSSRQAACRLRAAGCVAGKPASARGPTPQSQFFPPSRAAPPFLLLSGTAARRSFRLSRTDRIMGGVASPHGTARRPSARVRPPRARGWGSLCGHRRGQVRGGGCRRKPTHLRARGQAGSSARTNGHCRRH